MLTVDELWALLDQTVLPLPCVEAPLEEAMGHRLGEDILADEDLPAFTRSAIDGFLLPFEAAPGRYRIVGEIKPGTQVSAPPVAGEALRVYTGSALPEGGLVMVEDTRIEGDFVITSEPSSQRHVRPRASQARCGDVLLPSGSVVSAGTLALAATVGRFRLKVSPRIRVAHLVTGRELVSPSEKPGPGFIRDSNSVMIEALLGQSGANRVFHARVSEDTALGVSTLQSVEADLFLISGGASVGSYDGTAETLCRLGFTIRSDKVRSRPGKPFIFATRGRQVAFGLPGNPLSHFVCFHLFVERALRCLQGLPPQNLVAVKIDGPSPSPDPRETWWPARVHGIGGELRASPLPWRDSSDLTDLPRANALLRVASSGGNGLVQALVFGSLEA